MTESPTPGSTAFPALRGFRELVLAMTLSGEAR